MVGCFLLNYELSVTGGELVQRILREDQWTESECAFYVRQLLLALEHMHAKNVVHLDVKVSPKSCIYVTGLFFYQLENLFLEAVGSDILKILDFGCARQYTGDVITFRQQL